MGSPRDGDVARDRKIKKSRQDRTGENLGISVKFLMEQDHEP